jgi:hypothetical protein
VRGLDQRVLDPGGAVGDDRPASVFADLLAFLPDAKAAERPPLAVDLGCRRGEETVELLRRGWTVLAVTESRSAKRRVEGSVPRALSARVTVVIGDFGSLLLPPADLIHTGTNLPLRPRAQLGPAWSRIVPAIRGGGWFAGQFLIGPPDRADELSYVTRKQVVALLSGFRIELLREEDEALRVVARRRPGSQSAARSE